MLNRCRDVVISLRQPAGRVKEEGRENYEARHGKDKEISYEEKVGWDVFQPSPLKQPRAVPFAWDEPSVGERAIQVGGRGGVGGTGKRGTSVASTRAP